MIELVSFDWETATALIRDEGGHFHLQFPYESREAAPTPKGRRPAPLAAFGFAETLQENLLLRHRIMVAGFVGSMLHWVKKKTGAPDEALFRQMLVTWGSGWVKNKQNGKILTTLHALRTIEGFTDEAMRPFLQRIAQFHPALLPAAQAIASLRARRVDLEKEPVLPLLQTRGATEGIAQLGLDALFYLKLRGHIDRSGSGDFFTGLYQELRTERNRARAIESNKARQPWQKGAGSMKHYIRGAKS